MAEDKKVRMVLAQKEVHISDRFTFVNALYLNEVAMYQNQIDRIIITNPSKNNGKH